MTALPHRPGGPTPRAVIVAFLTVTGLGAVGWAWWGLLRTASSSDWPTVRGEVVEASVARRRVHTDGGTRVRLEPRIRYRYEVAGVARVGERYAFGPPPSRDADSIVAAHPAGSSVTVHYDPDDPSRSVLVPGAPSGDTVVLMAGLLLWILAAAVAARLVPLRPGADVPFSSWGSGLPPDAPPSRRAGLGPGVVQRRKAVTVVVAAVLLGYAVWALWLR